MSTKTKCFDNVCAPVDTAVYKNCEGAFGRFLSAWDRRIQLFWILHDRLAETGRASCFWAKEVRGVFSDLQQSIKRRPVGLQLSTTVVRDDYASSSELISHRSIFGGLDTLDEDRLIRHGFDPFEILPAHRRIDGTEHGLTVVGGVRTVVSPADCRRWWHEVTLVPDIALSLAHDRSIGSKEDSADAEGVSLLQQVLCTFTVATDV